MKTPAVLLAVPLALAAATIAAPSSAQTLEISHADGKAAIVLPNGNRVSFDHEDEIRIDPNRVTAIRITNTNSALYTCQVDQKEVEVPETAALREFLAQAGPLIPGAISLGLGEKSLMSLRFDVDDDDDAGDSAEEEALRNQVRRVDDAIFGPQGFMQSHLTTLETLNAMRAPDASVESLAADLQRNLPCADGDCTRLAFVDNIANALEGLFVARRDFVAADGQAPDLKARADSILANANGLLKAAHEVEALAITVAHAKPVIDCDPVQVSRSKGRELTVAVKKRAEPELARVAPHGARTLKATAMPRLRPHPSVGVSLLYAPDAQYDKFTTVDEAGGARIATSGTQDERIGYGLVLGLAWNDRVGPRQPRLRVWLPEITINPTEELKTIGVGGGVSLGILKVGGGWVWNRHNRLDGQRVGDLLDDAGLLSQKETYGRPRPYVSLSFMGWPPFLN